jgi:hypothetical protein
MLSNDPMVITSNVERLRTILGLRSGLARGREHLLGLREKLKRAPQPERRRLRRISSHRNRKFGHATGRREFPVPTPLCSRVRRR